MNWRALIFCPLVAACNQPLPDDELIAALPKSMRIPSCVSIDHEDSYGVSHTRRKDGFQDAVYFTGSRECMDQWSVDLGMSSADRGPLYFKRDDTGYVMVVRVIDTYAPAGDRAFVQWLHDKPVERADYHDMRD